MLEFLTSIWIAVFGVNSPPEKLFTNDYIEFKIPADWECNNHSYEWKCSSDADKNGAKASITTSVVWVDSGKLSIPQIQALERAAGRSGALFIAKWRQQRWVDSGIEREPTKVSRSLQTEEAGQHIKIKVIVEENDPLILHQLFNTMTKELRAYRRQAH